MTNYKSMIPILNNSNIAYLDYSATTFMPAEVMNKWSEFHNTVGVFVSRGINNLSRKAEIALRDAEEVFNDFFGFNSEYSIIYAKNVTELINITAMSIEESVNEMDIVLVGPYEHHSNYLPWKYLAKRRGALFCELPINAQGDIDYSYIERYRNRIKVISVSSVSNTFGHNIDVEKICKLKSKDAFLFVDESQCCAHSPISRDRRISGHFITSHKMYGPKNIALMSINNSIITSLKPVFLGGGMLESVGYEDTWLSDRKKFFAGTMDIGLICALAEACNFVKSVSYEEIKKMDSNHYSRVVEMLNACGMRVLHDEKRCSNSLVAFVHPYIHAHDINEYLAKNDVIIRSGHLCSQNSLRKMEEHAINRISYGIGTDDNDLDKLEFYLKELRNEQH